MLPEVKERADLSAPSSLTAPPKHNILFFVLASDFSSVEFWSL